MAKEFKESLTNELLNRAELTERIKEFLLLLYLVLENDYSYTEQLIENGKEYEVTSLFDLPKYFPAKNIRALNSSMQELLIYLDTSLDEIFTEIADIEFEDD